MSYTPTEWATGDVITAEKLNNMESGIVGAGSTLMVTATGNPDTGITLNKTFGEIKEAIMAGSLFYVQMLQTQAEMTVCVQQPAESFSFNEGGGGAIVVRGDAFSALTDNDYPFLQSQ